MAESDLSLVVLQGREDALLEEVRDYYCNLEEGSSRIECWWMYIMTHERTRTWTRRTRAWIWTRSEKSWWR
eukprot:UN21214